MRAEYNPYTFVLTIQPEAGQTLKFKDIGFIRFGNSFQEANVCDAQGFSYKVSSIDIKKSTD